jgi:integrase
LILIYKLKILGILFDPRDLFKDPIALIQILYCFSYRHSYQILISLFISAYIPIWILFLVVCLVDPGLVDLKSLGDDARYRIFDYLWERGVRSSDLGIDPTYANKVRNRRVRVSDALLERMLRMLSVGEFTSLVSSSQAVDQALQQVAWEPRSLGEAAIALDQYIRGIEAVIERYPQLSSVAIQRISEVLRRRAGGYSIAITKDHIDTFEKILRSRAPKTRDKRLRYLRRALRDLDWELSAERLQEYLVELSEESPNVAGHVAKALKLFIKHVLRDPNLYQAFKMPRAERGSAAEPLTLETVRAVARAIDWIPAKAFYALLAETGLRPGEVLNARLGDLDLGERMLRIMRIGSTKRSYVAFFSEGLKSYLEKQYLPYRGDFVSKAEPRVGNLLRDTAEWRNLLFPFKDSALRASIYDAMEKTLGKRFRLYDLRAFHASYLSIKGVPGQIIDLLQGRVPPREFQILARHYLAIGVKELRDIYDRAGLSVLG